MVLCNSVMYAKLC